MKRRDCIQWALGLSAFVTLGCQRKKRSTEDRSTFYRGGPGEVNWIEVNPDFWYTDNVRIAKWRAHYNKTRDPWKLWKKSKRYLPEIQAMLAENRLPNELCLLPMIESSFEPSARSERAAGMWQFIVPTAQEMGLIVNTKLDERLDWAKSTVAAGKYLEQLAIQFDGDWALVLGAYNVGPGAMKRALVAQGTWNFWDLKLREETMEYVPRFLAMVQLLRESFPKV